MLVAWTASQTSGVALDLCFDHSICVGLGGSQVSTGAGLSFFHACQLAMVRACETASVVLGQHCTLAPEVPLYLTRLCDILTCI